MTHDSLTDYSRACDGAAFFDLSHHGHVEATGKDAAAFLNNLCSNDVKRLTVGQGCEAFFTNAKARIIAHVWMQCVEREGATAYWIDAGPGHGAALFEHLNRYLISEQVELTDRTQELAELHVAGPQAESVLKAVGADSRWLIHRHDRLALPGYDVRGVATEMDSIRQALLQAGCVPAGHEAYNVLRLEAGMPAYGAEIDDTRLAMELNRTSQAISYAKGCYLGQETIVMARDRGHVNRMLFGLKLTGNELALAGAKVFASTEEVGQVTSSAFSPRVGAAVALAFLRRGHQQTGSVLEVATNGVRRTAEVAGLPLVGG